MKVGDRLEKLKRWFLWGGNSNQKKIAWVSWGTVCMPKEAGGLGIRDLRKFNYVLLGKWHWNLFHCQGELWAQVLNSKYGGWRNLDEIRRSNRESIWWRDLSFICNLPEEGSWFNSNIKWKIGSVSKVLFWEDAWKEDGVLLKEKYPRLY